MRTKLLITYTLAALVLIFAIPAHAEEQTDDLVTVRGLVVSSGNELIINDGERDYLLLGVDDFNLEGTICEAVGIISDIGGAPTLMVISIRSLANFYPADDPIGFQDIGKPYLGQLRPGIQGGTMVSPGVSMSGLGSRNLLFRSETKRG